VRRSSRDQPPCYSLASGNGGALIRLLNKAFLAYLGDEAPTGNLPEAVFALFQMTFAIIPRALIIGASAERVRFPFVLLFTMGWVVIVYPPVAHWVWGGGCAAAAGLVDFAGGIVIHATAGVTALVTAIMVGARERFPCSVPPPHSPGMTMAGAGILWVGWFGFNGGSKLEADASAGIAILATQFAASAAALTWMAAEWLRAGKPTSVGLVTGGIAVLATITPAAGRRADGSHYWTLGNSGHRGRPHPRRSRRTLAFRASNLKDREPAYRLTSERQNPSSACNNGFREELLIKPLANRDGHVFRRNYGQHSKASISSDTATSNQ
jgi:hypothetical protein